MTDAQQVVGYTLADLAAKLQVELRGDGEIEINSLATLATATAGQLTFLANPKYRDQLKQTRASAVILHPDMAGACSTALLISDNPYLSFARATRLFERKPGVSPGVHPSAVIADSAQIDPGAAIAANCTIEAGAVIEQGVIIGPGCVVGQDSTIGSNSVLHANVTLYHDVKIGCDAIIHSGVVIGADGFGFAQDGKEWVKIAQLGGVTIGQSVEIGAGTTIDRGALEDTYIDDGVIIDNQVQLAHNVRVGKNTAIAGCSAVAGSTVIGANCTIAGAVGIIGHLKIADNVHITAMSLVTKSITRPGSYSSGTSMMDTGHWRRSAVRFGQLDSIYSRLLALENQHTQSSGD